MPSTDEMLSQFNLVYRLNEQAMDDTHVEFLKLCQQALAAQGSLFGERFKELFEHTQQHFADEEQGMQISRYPAYAEHRADHQRILGDMDRFCQRALAGRSSMARAWLADSLPAWFDTHARTMDSALAAHLKS